MLLQIMFVTNDMHMYRGDSLIWMLGFGDIFTFLYRKLLAYSEILSSGR